MLHYGPGILESYLFAEKCLFKSFTDYKILFILINLMIHTYDLNNLYNNEDI